MVAVSEVKFKSFLTSLPSATTPWIGGVTSIRTGDNILRI